MSPLGNLHNRTGQMTRQRTFAYLASLAALPAAGAIVPAALSTPASAATAGVSPAAQVALAGQAADIAVSTSADIWCDGWVNVWPEGRWGNGWWEAGPCGGAWIQSPKGGAVPATSLRDLAGLS